MPSPFPGMDPYLENPSIWPDVHHRLISEIQTALNPGLRPDYVARVELRVYISDQEDPGREVMIPDLRIERSAASARKGKRSNGTAVALVEPEILLLDDEEIKEAHLEIRHRESNALVTIIEILSPTNKVRGSRGREDFLSKRRESREAGVHWVEIDLLRAGTPTVMQLGPSDYRIVMYRAEDRKCRCWRFGVRDGMPAFGVPLRSKDADLPLDLAAVMKAAYDNASYDLSIDYRKDPKPPLPAADKKWADKLLRQCGLR